MARAGNGMIPGIQTEPVRAWEKSMEDTKQDTAADHLIHYTVDGEPQTTTERILTPVQILVAAGLNPAERYLVLIQGDHQTSYQGTPEAEVHMHPHMAFVTIYTGPVPVS